MSSEQPHFTHRKTIPPEWGITNEQFAHNKARYWLTIHHLANDIWRRTHTPTAQTETTTPQS